MRYWAPVLSVALALATLAIHNHRFQPWMLDDAYISFRYAENLALGKGLVFNEGEHVEGYTTFLWVMLLAVGSALGLPLEPYSRVLSVGFAVGVALLLALASRIAPRLPDGAGPVSLLLTGTCGVFTAWTMCGMEVPMVAFWGILAVLLHLRAREFSFSPLSTAQPLKTEGKYATLACALSCVLATMSRPESVLLFLVLFVDRLILSIRRRDGDFFVFGLAFSAIYLPYFAWRFWYYGHFLPNTFYAKVGDNAGQLLRGWNYTTEFLSMGFTTAAPAYAALLCLAALGKRHGGLYALGGFVLVHTLYVVAVGGDGMFASRFYSSVLPAFGLLGGCLLAPMLRRPLPFLLAAALILAFNMAQIHSARKLNTKDPVARLGLAVGNWLRQQVPPDTLIATNTAGSIPYASKLPTIDTLGLNDETIAHRYVPTLGTGHAGHEKGDGAYVLSRRPDIIQFGSATGKKDPSFLGDEEVFKSPQFRKDYVFRRYALPGGGMVQLYIRKDREAALGLPAPLK